MLSSNVTMAMELSALEPSEVVLPIVAMIGLVPVVLQYRRESKWFAVGYLFLIVATLSTNLEALFLGDVLNFAEHSLGLMGSGLAFLAAGYLRRKRILGEDNEDAGPDVAAEAGV